MDARLVVATDGNSAAMRASISTDSTPSRCARFVRWLDLPVAITRDSFCRDAKQAVVFNNELVDVDRWFFVLVVSTWA